MALLCGLAIPLDGFDKVWLGAFSLFVGRPGRILIFLVSPLSVAEPRLEFLLGRHFLQNSISLLLGFLISLGQCGAEPDVCCRQIDRNPRSVGTGTRKTHLGVHVAFFSGQAIPFGRFHKVLIYAQAICIENSEVVLGRFVILFGGSAKKLCGLRVILRHALALRVEDREVELCGHVSVRRGPYPPRCCLRRIGVYALAGKVSHSELELGYQVALTSLLLQGLDCRRSRSWLLCQAAVARGKIEKRGGKHP